MEKRALLGLLILVFISFDFTATLEKMLNEALYTHSATVISICHSVLNLMPFIGTLKMGYDLSKRRPCICFWFITFSYMLLIHFTDVAYLLKLSDTTRHPCKKQRKNLWTVLSFVYVLVCCHSNSSKNASKTQDEFRGSSSMVWFQKSQSLVQNFNDKAKIFFERFRMNTRTLFK